MGSVYKIEHVSGDDSCGFGFGLIEAFSVAGSFGTMMYMGLKAMMKNILMLLVLALFVFKFHEFEYEVPVVSFSISFCIGILELTRSMRYLLFHLDLMLSFHFYIVRMMSLERLSPHARGLKFESLRGGFPSRWESVGFYLIDASIRD
ncbi:hypothetical protein Tco_0827052 [Tanacetum coccineum]